MAEEKSGRQSLCVIPANDGRSFHKDELGIIGGLQVRGRGRSFEVPENTKQAYEAAKAFDNFNQVLGFAGEPLIDTIPDFHNTRMRFESFRSSVEKDQAIGSPK